MQSQKTKKIMTYLGTSLLYCVISFALLTAALYPFVRDYLPALSLVIGDKSVSFDEENASGEIRELSEITGGVLKSSEVHYPVYGEKLGNIKITGEGKTSVDADLYFGDGDAQLRAGAGVYMGSTPPGYNSTVLIAGHNHTWFKPLKSVQTGDTVTLTTYYGVYVYEITDIQVKQVTDTSHYDLCASEENLVLYTCYPFGSIGMTPTRYFLYGKFISGPMINVKE